MDVRPQIDFDKLHDIVETDNSYQHAPYNQDPPARFCDTACRESYREDRIAGKLLPNVELEGHTVSHKTMCARLNLCALCLSKLD